MNKVVIAIVVAIVVIGGAILFLLGGDKKITNVVPSQPTTEPEGQQSQQAPALNQPSNTIELTKEGFDPQTMTIKVGTKVSWVNKSGAVASVNSDPHPIHSNHQPLNLNSFEEGGLLELVFERAGTYSYHDHLNPGRTGTVVVE